MGIRRMLPRQRCRANSANVCFRASNLDRRPAAMGRVESVDLTGTSRSRRADKLATLAPGVQPFADIHGVAGRLPERQVYGGQREFVSPGRAAATAALPALVSQRWPPLRVSQRQQGERFHRRKADPKVERPDSRRPRSAVADPKPSDRSAISPPPSRRSSSRTDRAAGAIRKQLLTRLPQRSQDLSLELFIGDCPWQASRRRRSGPSASKRPRSWLSGAATWRVSPAVQPDRRPWRHRQHARFRA